MDGYHTPIDIRLLSINIHTHETPKCVGFYIIVHKMSISKGFEYSCLYPMSKLKKP
jgi:hypothetical protein